MLEERKARRAPAAAFFITLGLLGLLGFACAEKGAKVPDNPPPVETATTSAPPEPALDPAPATDCVQECIRRSQARAIGAQMIEEECKQECASTEE